MFYLNSIDSNFIVSEKILGSCCEVLHMRSVPCQWKILLSAHSAIVHLWNGQLIRSVLRLQVELLTSQSI